MVLLGQIIDSTKAGLDAHPEGKAKSDWRMELFVVTSNFHWKYWVLPSPPLLILKKKKKVSMVLLDAVFEVVEIELKSPILPWRVHLGSPLIWNS